LRFIFYLALLVSGFPSYSQLNNLETSQWWFGNSCGLSFQNGSPQSITGSTMHAGYSSACMSDSNGNLLFYVRGGELVYDKLHDTMSNGWNIGGFYSPQSGLIIPKGNHQYYIFTHNNSNFFSPWPFPPMNAYSIVDMGLASGMGSVTISNQAMTQPGLPMVSKLAATKHCNGKDYWVLAHQGGYPGSTNYFAYQVNSVAVNTVPVISSIGSNQSQAYNQPVLFYSGKHKFSPNGRKVAACMMYSKLELYDFNSNTGQLSNMIRLDSLNVLPQIPGLSQNVTDLEFSPDGTKLYVSYVNDHPHICQFDLSLSTASAVIASKTIISPDTIFGNTSPHPLQLARNGKIYAIEESSVHLSVINNPNATGLACAFAPQAIYFGTITSFPYTVQVSANLPNFASSYFEQKPSLPTLSNIITCGVINFTAPVLSAMAGYNVSSYQWNFNDALSGTNTSTLANPSHTFSANGTYTVKLTLNYHPCGTDTLKQVINITGLPVLGISGKTTICKNETVVLSFSGADTYTLNALALTQNSAQVSPTISTVYTLSATNATTGCTSLKTFSITVLPCVGLSETGLSEGLRVYPNPNTGVFTFETPETCEVKILNSLGQEVYQRSISAGSCEIDISKAAKGIYILEWKSDTNSRQIKLIVE